MCRLGQAQWGTKGAKEPSTALLKALDLRRMCNCQRLKTLTVSLTIRLCLWIVLPHGNSAHVVTSQSYSDICERVNKNFQTQFSAQTLCDVEATLVVRSKLDIFYLILINFQSSFS